MLTIDPDRRSIMLRRRTSRLHSIAAVTSMAIVAFQLSSVCSQTWRSVPGWAALFIITSTRPKASMAVPTMRTTCCSSVTSVVTLATAPPASRTSWAVSSSCAVRRAASTSDAPSALNRPAITRPRPSLAPVMMTTLPVRRPIVGTLVERREGDRLVDAAQPVRLQRPDAEAGVVGHQVPHRGGHHDRPGRALLHGAGDEVDQRAEVVAVAEQHGAEPHRAPRRREL